MASRFKSGTPDLPLSLKAGYYLSEVGAAKSLIDSQSGGLTLRKVLAYDSFNRADNTVLGNADTAQAWSISAGSAWGITANEAIINTTSTGRDNAVLDVGQSNCVVSAAFMSTTKSHRLVLRYVDDSNHLILNSSSAGTSYSFSKVEAGASTQLASFSVTRVAGDILKCVLNGSDITCYRNGSLIFSVNTSFNLTATKHGLGGNNQTAVAFNDFVIEVL